MGTAEDMRTLGIAQRGDPVLACAAKPFRLPDEADEACELELQLFDILHRLRSVHDFNKGMGIAAPQIGVSRALAVVCALGRPAVTLLNPRVQGMSAAEDEQYEGCLSFFDERGIVSRPLQVVVANHRIDGSGYTRFFSNAEARLVCHEIDHLNGMLYTQRMAPDAACVPAAECPTEGTAWHY